MTPTPQKTCPGYGAQGAHVLAATTDNFHKNAPAKDGLFYQCKSCANAYQQDYMARNRALSKANAMEPGSERDAAIATAQAMPPPPRQRKATPAELAQAISEGVAQGKADSAAAQAQELGLTTQPPAKRLSALPPQEIDKAVAAGLVANEPRMQAMAAQARQPGWTTTTVAGAIYAIPQDVAAVETPEGQAALQVVHEAKKSQWRQAKRDQAARAKAEAATASA